jgi:hypothetical protein
VPSVRTAQAKASPVATLRKVPVGGGTRFEFEKVKHASVPSGLTPHVYKKPAEMLSNVPVGWGAVKYP